MTDCTRITSDISFQQKGLVKITVFFLWKLNAIISIKLIQNTEGVDTLDRRVKRRGDTGARGGYDPPSTSVAESLLGQRRELISLGSEFYFVCEFIIILLYFFGL